MLEGCGYLLKSVIKIALVIFVLGLIVWLFGIIVAFIDVVLVAALGIGALGFCIFLFKYLKKQAEYAKINARANELLPLAERGDSEAQYELACIMEKQKRYSNYERMEWFKKAAAQGHKKAKEAIERAEEEARWAENRAELARITSSNDDIDYRNVEGYKDVKKFFEDRIK